MRPGSDHGDDRLGELGVEAGEGVAQFAAPHGPEEAFDFQRLAAVVFDGGYEDGRRLLKRGPRLLGEAALKVDGGGEFGKCGGVGG
jgi:hypothetical protein